MAYSVKFELDNLQPPNAPKFGYKQDQSNFKSESLEDTIKFVIECLGRFYDFPTFEFYKNISHIHFCSNLYEYDHGDIWVTGCSEIDFDIIKNRICQRRWNSLKERNALTEEYHRLTSKKFWMNRSF